MLLWCHGKVMYGECVRLGFMCALSAADLYQGWFLN